MTLTRRELMAGAGALALGTAAPPARARSANERLNIAMVGTANQARFSMDNVRTEEIVALCDVDENYLAAAARDYPKAALYRDFRRMMERRDIDAVIVATPDHIHAPATLAALETGRHVYCEKPLTHTVAEARKVAEAARRHGRATQMGTQIHAGENYRRVVEIVQSGAIGPVREVHCWVGKVWSGSGVVDNPPVPRHLHWDLWLGPAPERPYSPAYHPGGWRGFWDFGGGTLADMGCHHMDLPFWALGLRHPVTVEAAGSPYSWDMAARWLEVRYEFPARGAQPPVRLTWHDGGRRPPQFAEGLLPQWGDGTLFIGERGMLLADYGRYRLLPEKEFADHQPPPPTIPRSIGHHAEWIRACKTGEPTTCNFDYAGALTEAVLLGAVAYRTGQRLEWDPVSLRCPNCPDADAYLRKAYRHGWELSLQSP